MNEDEFDCWMKDEQLDHMIQQLELQ